jgi:hypothetical protein
LDASAQMAAKLGPGAAGFQGNPWWVTRMSFTLGSIGYIEIDISYIRNYICVIIHASCNNDNNNDNNNDDNNDDNDNDDNDDDNDNNYYYIHIYIVEFCGCVRVCDMYTTLHVYNLK